jgi:hypothetical protein
MGPIQLKGLKGIPTTACIDLSNSAPYTLCQDIQLTVGTKYQLNYSLYCMYVFKQLLVTAYINSINISSLPVLTNKFAKKTEYFVANVSGSNQLCFD